MRASAGGAAAARATTRRRSPTTARCSSRTTTLPPAAASSSARCRRAAPPPTCRRCAPSATNLINLGGGGVPILGGAADGDEAEGEEGAAAADEAISRAETDGFVEELDARARRPPGGERVLASRRCGVDGAAAADEAAERCVLGCSHRFHLAVHRRLVATRRALPAVHGSDGQLVIACLLGRRDSPQGDVRPRDSRSRSPSSPSRRRVLPPTSTLVAASNALTAAAAWAARGALMLPTSRPPRASSPSTAPARSSMPPPSRRGVAQSGVQTRDRPATSARWRLTRSMSPRRSDSSEGNMRRRASAGRRRHRASYARRRRGPALARRAVGRRPSARKVPVVGIAGGASPCSRARPCGASALEHRTRRRRHGCRDDLAVGAQFQRGRFAPAAAAVLRAPARHLLGTRSALSERGRLFRALSSSTIHHHHPTWRQPSTRRGDDDVPVADERACAAEIASRAPGTSSASGTHGRTTSRRCSNRWRRLRAAPDRCVASGRNLLQS